MRGALVLAALLLGGSVHTPEADAQATSVEASRAVDTAPTVTTTTRTTAGRTTTTTTVTNGPTRSRGPAPPSTGAARRAERRMAVSANDLHAPYGVRRGDARREAAPTKGEVRRATRQAERSNRYGTRYLSHEASDRRPDANRRPSPR